MGSFVGKRREVWWIQVAPDAETRQVVAMVAGDRAAAAVRDPTRGRPEHVPDRWCPAAERGPAFDLIGRCGRAHHEAGRQTCDIGCGGDQRPG